MKLAMRSAPACDLTRHFFREFFYLRFLTDAGADAVKRTMMSIVAGFLSLFILFPQTVIARYAALSARSGPDGYRQAFLADQFLTICVSMFIVGFVAALVCQSLFPDETDYRILMALPVTRRLVFGTKMLALVLFAGMFIVATIVVFGLAFAAAADGRWAEQPVLVRMLAHAAVTGVASVFAGAAVMCLQGLIAVLSPRSWLHAISVATQTAMICALILSLPAMTRLSGQLAILKTGPRLWYFAPPVWFLGLEQVLLGRRDPYFLRLGGLALLALAASILVTGVCYLAVYRRFDLRVLRPSHTHRLARRWPGWMRRSLRSDGTHPAGAAVALFTRATLRRSGLHQVVFCGISAGGVAMAINSLESLIALPLVLMFFGVSAVRTALLLPLEVRANWMFRLTENDATRHHQLDAVVRTLIRLGVLPYLVLTLALQALGLGVADALRALVITTLLGLLLVEVVVRNWRRIPFTCTYIPGKRQLVHSMLLTLSAYAVFVSIGSRLIDASLRHPGRFVSLLLVLLAALVLMRRARLASLGRMPLEFEDSLPDDATVIPLS